MASQLIFCSWVQTCPSKRSFSLHILCTFTHEGDILTFHFFLQLKQKPFLLKEMIFSNLVNWVVSFCCLLIPTPLVAAAVSCLNLPLSQSLHKELHIFSAPISKAFSQQGKEQMWILLLWTKLFPNNSHTEALHLSTSELRLILEMKHLERWLN